MKTTVFFVLLLIGLALAAANNNVCGNGHDEQSMRCRGEFVDREGSVAVLAADNTVDREPTKDEVEQIIRERLTPFTGKAIECSFKCDHKQKEFEGCYCTSEIRYNTTLAKCPDDVTRVSSSSLKWAWDQCQAAKCECALIDDTIADQCTLYAYRVLDKVQPVRKDGDLQGFFKIIKKVFTTKILGFEPDSFASNLKHYIARAVRKIASFLNLAKVAAFFGQAFKAIGKGVQTAFESVKQFFSNVGGHFTNLIKKNGVTHAVATWLKKKFGAAGQVIANVFSKAKSMVSAAGRAFKRVYTAIKNNPIVRKFIGGVKKVYGLAKAGLRRLGGFAKQLGIKLGRGIKNGFLKAKEGFKKLAGGVKKGWNKVSNGAKKLGRGLKKGWSKLGGGLKKGWRKLGGGVRKFGGKAKNSIKRIGSGLRKFGSGLKRGFSGLSRKFGGKAFKKIGGIAKKFGNNVRKFENKVARSFNSVKRGFSGAVRNFSRGFSRVSSGIASNVGKSFSKAGTGLKKVGSFAKSGLRKAGSFLSRI